MGFVGSLTSISAAGTTDPDGDTLTYIWRTDDTVRVLLLDVSHNPRYRDIQFLDDGIYQISVIATDPAGAADTATATIPVSTVAPKISDVRVPPGQPVATPVELIIWYSDDAMDTHRLITRWGDGVTDTTPGPVMWGDTATHRYSAPGTYPINISVVDDDGNRDSLLVPDTIVIFDPSVRGAIAGYQTLDLGTFGGFTATAADINNLGQVVGSARAIGPDVGDDAGQHGFDHGFLWNNGVLRDLGTLQEDRGSSAQRLNDDGVVAGSSWWVDYGTSSSTIWLNGVGVGTREPPFADERVKATAVAVNSVGDVLWTRRGEHRTTSVLQPHGNAAGKAIGEEFHDVYASAMNNSGQIVGWYAYARDGADFWVDRAFVWEKGAMRELRPLGYRHCLNSDNQCTEVRALDINEAGQSVGFSVGPDGQEHFVSWTVEGAVTDLGVALLDIEGVPPQAVWIPSNRRIAINDRGQIAGSAGGQAFFWSDGVAHPLGSLGGGHSDVVDINQIGTVVGMSSTPNGDQHIFIWSQARGMVDLGTGPQGLSGAWATGINDYGDVIGISAQCVRSYPGQTECLTPDQPRATLWRIQR